MINIKTVLLVMIILFLITCSRAAIDLDINKLTDFSVSQYRVGSNRVKNIIIDHPYLYTLTMYGLEVYEILPDASLELLTRKPIIRSWSMEKMDDFLFVGTKKDPYDPIHPMVHKIDVSDPSNPILVQSLELENVFRSVWYLLEVNDHFLLDTDAIPSFNPLINTNLEIIQENLVPYIPYVHYADDLLLTVISDGNYAIYDISDFSNVTFLGSANIAGVHDYGIQYHTVYQDTILVCNNQRELSFWDISEPDDWQLLHFIPYINNIEAIIFGMTLFLYNDFLLYLNPFNLVALDLNDYSFQHTAQDIGILSIGIDAASWQDNIYFTTMTQGIQHFNYIDDVFNFINTYGDNPGNSQVFANGSLLFVPFISLYWENQGVAVYDISEPLQPEEITRMFVGESLIYYGMVSNNLIVRSDDWGTYGNIEMYDVSNPFDPILSNTIDLSYWPNQHVMMSIDETDTDVLYLLLLDQMRLLKFDISQENSSELVFDYNLPYSSSFSFVAHGGCLYYMTRRGNSNWHDLRIYSASGEDEPELLNTITYFVYHELPYLKIVDEYLAVQIGITALDDPDSKTSFFTLSDPLNPELVFQNNIPGIPYIIDDLLFQSPGSAVFVYDLSEEPQGVIEPFTHFFHNIRSNSIIPYEANGTKYLFTSSMTSIGVYEYSYTVGVEDDIYAQHADKLLAQNYPNPFNPETTIRFNIAKEDEVKLEVFNIKGQRINKLLHDTLAAGEHQLIWDGKDDNGNSVSSGIYFYRLTTSANQEQRKMLLLK